jgi:hypothetical protein
MSHFIYVIATVGADGVLTAPVKVGISSQPYARLSAIQTSCPNKVRIAHLFRVRERATALHYERQTHDLWEECVISGEWFDANPDDVIDLLSLDIETDVIVLAGQQRHQIEFIEKTLGWTGVAVAKEKAAAERYIRAWEMQAA